MIPYKKLKKKSIFRICNLTSEVAKISVAKQILLRILLLFGKVEEEKKVNRM